MASIAEPASRSAGRYRWVKAWLAIGCAIALLLSANAVRDYRFVSRLLSTQQVRHQMTEMSVLVEQQSRRSEGGRQLLSTMQTSLREGESVTLLDADGLLIEHIGRLYPIFRFTAEEEHAAFSNREPLFRTVATPGGDVVVEAFAIHPSRKVPPPPSPPSGQPPGPRFLRLEIALPLKGADPTVLAPIRRNLAINLAAALSLLATVVLVGAGLRSYIRGRRLEDQVEIVRQVQARLLPDPAVAVRGVRMATVYRPSEQVAGDFYDVFPNQTNGFAAVIGDVSGKGLPAALLMGVIHGAVRTASWQGGQADHEMESGRLNRLLYERASDHRFASMFWCSYDLHRESMGYVNAGHCPPFLISRREGALTIERLTEGGPVLGLLPDASYRAAIVDVSPGDLLVMYSDGLVEATNKADEEFGEGRLEALLRHHFDETPETIRERLMSKWESFSPVSDTQDDLTIAIIRF